MEHTISVIRGRPYGHVPGHDYLDVEIEARDRAATLTVSWGRAQGGYEEEHGREEYTRRAATTADAIEDVRDAAMDEQRGESRRYVESAASEALRLALDEDTEADEVDDLGVDTEATEGD